MSEWCEICDRNPSVVCRQCAPRFAATSGTVPQSAAPQREHKLGCDDYHQHNTPKCCAPECWCKAAQPALPEAPYPEGYYGPKPGFMLQAEARPSAREWLDKHYKDRNRVNVTANTFGYAQVVELLEAFRVASLSPQVQPPDDPMEALDIIAAEVEDYRHTSTNKECADQIVKYIRSLRDEKYSPVEEKGPKEVAEPAQVQPEQEP